MRTMLLVAVTFAALAVECQKGGEKPSPEPAKADAELVAEKLPPAARRPVGDKVDPRKAEDAKRPTSAAAEKEGLPADGTEEEEEDVSDFAASEW